jgi:hypothetical protein
MQELRQAGVSVDRYDFHLSKTPFSNWLLANHLMTSVKNDVAALELARQLLVR